MTVQKLMDLLSEIDNKNKEVIGIWLPQDKNYIFWIETVEDDIDEVILNIDTQ